MDLTEEDIFSAIASPEAFAQAVATKSQGWYGLFYREKDQLLARVRQTRSLGARARAAGGHDEQVVALAAEHARLERVNDLISQAAALRDTSPKVQQMIGDNKAQRVLGGEAPRKSHTRSMSWQDQPRQRTDTESADESEQEKLANELTEGRRMVEQNLRRLVENEVRPSPPRRRSRTLDSNPAPKKVTFNVPEGRADSIASGMSNTSGSSYASGSSRTSGGSSASASSQLSRSSFASDQEQPSKAMKMLGLGRNTKPQQEVGRSVKKEEPKRTTKPKEDPLVRFYTGR